MAVLTFANVLLELAMSRSRRENGTRSAAYGVLATSHWSRMGCPELRRFDLTGWTTLLFLRQPRSCRYGSNQEGWSPIAPGPPQNHSGSSWCDAAVRQPSTCWPSFRYLVEGVHAVACDMVPRQAPLTSGRWSPTGTCVGCLIRAFHQERRKRARLRATLFGLNDRELKDIGITRVEIEYS
jgi:uncharacterized protein YjiS (DUF1127 family)